jgi:TPR repeat protein
MAMLIEFPKSSRFSARWNAASRQLDHGSARAALTVFEALAADGFVEAYAEIGSIYENGAGDVQRDLEQAYRWYQRGISEFDDAYGHIGVARIILNGYQDAGSKKEAAIHLNHAVNRGSPIAMTILGSLYHEGRFFPQNFKKAEDLYLNAIKAEYILPMVYLSKLYYETGRYLAWASLRFRATLLAFRFAANDGTDPRLWNVSGSR